ncbi:MAG TPA: sigma-70 family RNA polymerase sigma factor [Actinomycetota bacterium]|nr:sigma-70 family RNA polymerase sigma factor [Actinomycetota bacterium]
MSETADALQECFRTEWPVLMGAVARMVGDLHAAEEIVQDAMVSALGRWPFTGVPDRPGAWLMTAARNRARNYLRDAARQRTRLNAVPPLPEGDLEEPPAIEDDRLRLMFVSCHPLLGPDAQAALTLRWVAGLSTRQIARGFLQPEATVAQRIVRAKRTLAESGAGFAVPAPGEWAERLPGVLRVVYLIFNEGHTAGEGDDLTRPDLCDEALRLGRLLAELVPAEPEVHGLLALMAYTASRLPARTDSQGDIVVLADQDRSRWDRALIQAGDGALRRAEALAGAERGPLTLQGAIAGIHARAPSWEATDWAALVALYDRLSETAPSDVVALNRAVAVAMASGPRAALPALDDLVDAGSLGHYHLLWATRADLLRRAGRPGEAIADYDRALQLVHNVAEERFLAARRAQCAAEAGIA